MGDVPVIATGKWFRRTDVSADGEAVGRRLERVFDRELDVAGDLDAVAREELDPIVRHGVVRRRDHRPGSGLLVDRQERHGRSGDDAGEKDVRPGGTQACDQRSFEHRSR
jgi:hypothetical protein